MKANRLTLLLLRNAPLLLFVILLMVFGSQSRHFLQVANFRNIIIQSAPIGILAIGMTFVLLVAQIDLSIGAVMYVTACIVALYLPGVPWPLALLAATAMGAVSGAVNAAIVTGLGVTSFIATLATLFVWRGIAMGLSDTRTLPFSNSIIDVNRTSFAGVPSAIVAFLVVFAVAWVVLEQTSFGRQLYAVGEDADAASKAGLPVRPITAASFIICSMLAGFGGFVTITQIGAVGPAYGEQVEFAAIAAAVLGGVSLFGGRGSVAGTVFGAILIKTTQNGLNLLDANPYVYPLVTASIIFIAVAVDGVRTRILSGMERRTVRPIETAEPAAGAPRTR